MEYWSNGKANNLDKFRRFPLLRFANTPTLQYSSTPAGNIFKVLKIYP